MHLLSTRPGGYVDDGGQGVVRVAQTPGDIVILSAAEASAPLAATMLASMAAAHAASSRSIASSGSATTMTVSKPAALSAFFAQVAWISSASIIRMRADACVNVSKITDPAPFRGDQNAGWPQCANS